MTDKTQKKLNGSQLAEAYKKQLEEWTKDVTDQQLIEITNPQTGLLERKAVAEACGFDRKNISNDKTQAGSTLQKFEDTLRERKILPQQTAEGIKVQSQPKSVDKVAIKRTREDSQVPKLQQRLLELESELQALKGELGRFSEISKVYKDLED